MKILKKNNIKTKFIYEGITYDKLYLFNIGNTMLHGLTREELIEKIKKRTLSSKELIRIQKNFPNLLLSK